MLTDAEIAGFMDWRGPGAYTAHKMRKVKVAIAEAVAREREACAKIADARAMRCEEKTALAEDAEEVTNLRSMAWQFSVLSAEMRKRSNVKLRGCPITEGESEK